MTRQLVFLPGVRFDLAEAWSYYEALAPRRGGERFEREFKRALKEVKTGFVTHRQAIPGYHRVLLRKFPYTVYYRIKDERAVIVALLYSRFDPSHIQQILKGRSSET